MDGTPLISECFHLLWRPWSFCLRGMVAKSLFFRCLAVLLAQAAGKGLLWLQRWSVRAPSAPDRPSLPWQTWSGASTHAPAHGFGGSISALSRTFRCSLSCAVGVPVSHSPACAWLHGVTSQTDLGPAWWFLDHVWPWLLPLGSDLQLDFLARPWTCLVTKNLPDGSGL